MVMEYSFRMEGLLKLKKFKEHSEKVNLGKIVKKMEHEKIEIVSLNESLEQLYECQSKTLKNGFLRVYPNMIGGIRDRIKSHNKKLKNLKKDYEKARNKLNVILGEVKALQKMKDAHKESWKKKITSKKEREMEDVINMRRGRG